MPEIYICDRMDVDMMAHSEEGMYKFVDPDGYLTSFLSHGIRSDGRPLTSARAVTLNVGSLSSADGSAMVRLGQTRVLAGVKMELSNPPLSCGTQGYLVCNIDLSSSSLPKTGSGPPSTEAQSLSQNLQSILSRFVNCEQLILLESKLCWTVFVDVVCLCNDGNIWDACVLAATAALMNTRVPVMQTDDGTPVVDLTSTPTPLKLGSPPLTASFAVMSDYCLLDPCHEEEVICNGYISLTHLEDNKIAQITHTGVPISSEKLVELCKDGQKHTQTVYKLLNTVCNHH